MRKRTALKLSLVIVVLAAAAAAVLYCRQKFVLPVLMYHCVHSPAAKGDLLTVSTPVFERQMRFLAEHRYTVLPLEQAAGAIRGKRKPSKTVCITFDDGYEDNFTCAFPILKKYRIPATVFVICSKVGTPGYLTWEEMAEMRDSGLVTFGSHTLSHRPLAGLTAEELARELAGSRRLLEEKLGAPVTLFAYPVGVFDDAVRSAVIAAGYTAAAATNPGKGWRDDDGFAIKRLRISENARNLFVFSFEASGYYNMIRESKKKKRKAK